MNKKIINHNYIIIYDVVSKGYRKINKDTIKSIKKYGI